MTRVQTCALPILLKYWEPVYGNNDKILSFKRKEKNWILNTNKINSYTVNTNTFIKDEICNIIYDPYNSGTGQVLNVSNNVLYIQHTTGTTLSNSTVLITSNSYIYGRESKVNTSFSTSNNIVTNVSPEEEVYWTPITYYTLENEKNQFNSNTGVCDFSTSYDLIHNIRFFHIWNYLQNNIYEKVLITDVRDVYFNSNPFDIISTTSITATSEEIIYEDEEWNKNHIHFHWRSCCMRSNFLPFTNNKAQLMHIIDNFIPIRGILVHRNRLNF